MHESEKWKWSHSIVSNFATSWTAAYQAPPSMRFSRQEYWSRVPLPSPLIRHFLCVRLCTMSLTRVVTKNLASLYTSAKLNPRDRVMREVGKDTFVALPVKGRRHTRFLPWKTVSQPQRTRWEFLWHWVKDSVSDNIRVWAGLVSAIIYFCFIDYAKAFDCVDHNKLLLPDLHIGFSRGRSGGLVQSIEVSKSWPMGHIWPTICFLK